MSQIIEAWHEMNKNLNEQRPLYEFTKKKDLLKELLSGIYDGDVNEAMAYVGGETVNKLSRWGSVLSSLVERNFLDNNDNEVDTLEESTNILKTRIFEFNKDLINRMSIEVSDGIKFWKERIEKQYENIIKKNSFGIYTIDDSGYIAEITHKSAYESKSNYIPE